LKLDHLSEVKVLDYDIFPRISRRVETCLLGCRRNCRCSPLARISRRVETTTSGGYSVLGLYGRPRISRRVETTPQQSQPGGGRAVYTRISRRVETQHPQEKSHAQTSRPESQEGLKHPASRVSVYVTRIHNLQNLKKG